MGVPFSLGRLSLPIPTPGILTKKFRAITEVHGRAVLYRVRVLFCEEAFGYVMRNEPSGTSSRIGRFASG